MTTILSLLALLPSVLSGIALTNLCWQSRGWRAAFEQVFLGAGLGIGAGSCLAFFWLLVWGAPGVSFLVFEGAISLLTGWIWLHAWRRRGRGLPKPGRVRLSWQGWVAVLIFGLAIAAALGIFGVFTFMNPNGDFDAWTMWNLRARFLFRSGADWMNAFSPQIDWMFHADYPLLLPLTNLTTWNLFGAETPRAPVLLAGMFLTSTVGLLTAHLARRGWGNALLAGVLLLASPRLLDLAAFQVADVPLAFFVLAACILGVEACASPEIRRGVLVLAGLALGLAGWTKNEGSLILLASLLAGGTLLLWKRGWRSIRWQDAAALAAGLGLPLAALLVFKIFIAPPGDLISGQTTAGIWQKLVDPERYAVIAVVFGRSLFSPGEYPLQITPLLLVYALAAGRRALIEGEKIGVRWAGLTLILCLLGYAGIYLLTPHQLEWHLRYSADRLFMQIYPAALLVLFVSLKPLENLKGTSQ